MQRREPLARAAAGRRVEQAGRTSGIGSDKIGRPDAPSSVSGGGRRVCDLARPTGLDTEKEQERAEDSRGPSEGLLRSALLLK